MRPIIVSSWCFHAALYTGEMCLWDVPKKAAQLGFAGVELQDLFLWPYGNRIMRAMRKVMGFGHAPLDREYDPALLRRVETALATGQVQCIVWDADTEFGSPTLRYDPIVYAQQAMRTASQLGASIVRITIDHARDTQQLAEAAASIKKLVPLAEKLGIRLAVENHSPMTDPVQLINLFETVNAPDYVGLCLDFGNLRAGSAQTDFARLAPYAIHAHAKCYAFDETGQETTIPFVERIRALDAAGYEGAISIEYEGDGPPTEAITAARRLIHNANP